MLSVRQGSFPGQFSEIVDIAVDANENIYIVDRGNDRIIKTDSNGSILWQTGKSGRQDGEFKGPKTLLSPLITNCLCSMQEMRASRYLTVTENFLESSEAKEANRAILGNPGVSPWNRGSSCMLVTAETKGYRRSFSNIPRKSPKRCLPNLRSTKSS